MADSDTAFATRLPKERAERVEDALEETDRSPAEFLRRAVQYYEEQNPDGIRALESDGFVDEMLSDLKR